MQVFISYSRKDETFVRRLAADLKVRDIEVWLDTKDLATADEDRWRRSIVQGIRESSVLIVVLSPDSVTSGPVERELTIAAETKRRIVPVVHRRCELPDGFQFELAGIQQIDFLDQPYDVAVEQLVARVRSAHAGEALRPPGPPGGGPVSAPTGPAAPTSSGDRPSRRRLVATLAAAGVVVGAIVLIVALSLAREGGDGGGGAEPGSTATEGESGTDPSAPSGGAPADTAPSKESMPDPTAGDEETADRIVAELQEAYNRRDWDTVRRIIEQPEKSDDYFFATYGHLDGFPRLEHGDSVVLAHEEIEDGARLLLTGALVAWDYGPAQEMRTAVVCVQWWVEPDAGHAPFNVVLADDGSERRTELDYWLPEEEFEQTAADHCG